MFAVVLEKPEKRGLCGVGVSVILTVEKMTALSGIDVDSYPFTDQ